MREHGHSYPELRFKTSETHERAYELFGVPVTDQKIQVLHRVGSRLPQWGANDFIFQSHVCSLPPLASLSLPLSVHTAQRASCAHTGANIHALLSPPRRDRAPRHRARSLRELAADAPSKMDVLNLDGDALAVDGAEVGIFVDFDEVGLGSLLHSSQRILCNADGRIIRAAAEVGHGAESSRRRSRAVSAHLPR